MAETAEERRRRLVAEAKSQASTAKLEQAASAATDADRSAAYGAAGKPAPAPAAAPVAAPATPQDAGGAVSTGAGSNVADGIRARGSETARAGLALLTEADRKVAVKVRNKDYASVKGYTDAMAGDAPVARKGIFDPERRRRARAGLATLSPSAAPSDAPSSTATSNPATTDDRRARARAGLATVSPAPAPAAAPPPVQVVIQQPGAAAPPPPSSGRAVPAGAAPRRAPGELPRSTTPAGAIPLEGETPANETPEQELARLEAEALAQTPDQLEARAAADYQPEVPSLEELEAEQKVREGIQQRQFDAQEQLAVAHVEMVEAAAEAEKEAYRQHEELTAEAEAAKADQDARVAHQLAASQEAKNLVQRTAKAAIDAAAVDPKRAWATMGTGRKLAFVLSAVAGGIAGASDPMAYVNKYIDQDIEQQREADAKAQANLGTAQAAAAEQDNLYQRTRQAVGDERVTADVVRVARLEQIQADLKRRFAAAGVEKVSAEQEVFLTKLEEEIAQGRMRIDSAAARNPEFFTKAVNVYGKGARAGMQLAGKEMIKAGVGAQERADAQEGELEKIDHKGRADAMGEQAKVAAKRGDKIGAEAYQFGKDTATAQVVIDGIDEILAMDDIAGYGYTEGIETPGKMTVDSKVDAVLESLGRLQSQGAITTDELENFSRMVYKGVKAGDGSLFENAETRLRENLGIVRSMVKRKIDAHKRGLRPEVRQYYDRNVASPDYAPIWSGGDDQDSRVEVD